MPDDFSSLELVDPTNWWMSEKLDGVRSLWDGRCFKDGIL